MSNLLEQAIIDAAALKEAALKSAEAALTEKYSQELKESLQKILEQEQPPENQQAPAQGGLESALPDSDGEEKISEKNKNSVAFKDIPSSFLDGPDDELITINFDDLKREINKSLNGDESESEESEENQDTGENTGESEQTEQPQQQALAEEIELDESILKEMSSCGSSYKKKKKTMYEDDSGMSDTGDGESELEEEMELDEQALNELAGTQTPAQINQLEKDAQAKAAKADAESDAAEATKAVQTAKALRTQKEKELEAAKQNLADALRRESEAAAKIGSQSELEEEIDMDVGDPSTFRKGTQASDKEQEEVFNTLAAKLTISIKEEVSRVAKQNKNLSEKLLEIEKINKDLKAHLSNHKNAVQELKEQLELMSITNAKLLYTNKVLDDVSLNERQKQTVVESLSRTTSVKEAKTVYETLQGAVQTVSEKKQKESLSEAINRGPSPFLARAKYASQDDALSERMKILAGIKNK